jgi:hypothetical protein
MRWQKSPVPSDALPLIWPNSLVQALVQYEATAKTWQYLRLACEVLRDEGFRSFIDRPGRREAAGY